MNYAGKRQKNPIFIDIWHLHYIYDRIIIAVVVTSVDRIVPLS